ncbi:PREDICTED: pro-cathepsin H [Poecilia mexicana]|uniref:Pro-cathepsin H n=1 Tax=Poecilia mexicana TaxID=48701 RepID=A0A3B3XCC0_9TELE|nr:PREDICTED: pro-cathepsin H [Poecilia mexicana]
MSRVWLLLSFVSLTSAFYLTKRDEFHFKSWMAQYNKAYDFEEYYQRLRIFTENKRMIDKHNEGNHSFTMGLNEFSDMTFNEFRKSFLLSEPQNCSATKGSYLSSNGPHPDSIDWRKKGNYITPVKNQGACGSCWTFSTTGCLESVTAISTGKLVPLSEQQLVDCAQDFNNHGCNGGLPSQAFEYIMYNKGLMTEKDYPYTAVEGVCYYEPSMAAAFVKEVRNITAYDEMGMVDAVATRNPVSFAFEVTSDFMHYHQGVYTSTECHNTTDKVNHAVLAVGYGQDNGTPYWIVKNSWGPYWGIDGYFLIERGKNMCGLAACSSFPVV